MRPRVGWTTLAGECSAGEDVRVDCELQTGAPDVAGENALDLFAIAATQCANDQMMIVVLSLIHI